MTPTAAMIFAAGYGTRMGALTANQPKPMIKVNNIPLIDRALNLTDDAGITRRVINLHYRADQLETHLKSTANLKLSVETTAPLETGGGLKKALPLLGSEPVFTLNPDVVWTGANPLIALANGWRPDHMGALLMLVPTAQVTGYSGQGDFCIDPQGRLSRATKSTTSNYLYCGAQILHTDGLALISETVFSLNILWNQMIAKGQLYGQIHQGGWADVGSPAGIAIAESLLDAADV